MAVVVTMAAGSLAVPAVAKASSWAGGAALAPTGAVAMTGSWVGKSFRG